MATPPPPIKLGSMVEVIGKGIVGKVAYIGSTLFSSGQYWNTNSRNVDLFIASSNI